MKNSSRLVLVGFGKDLTLINLLKLIGTEKEPFLLQAACMKDKPPIYKTESFASKEEVDSFVKYGKWLEAKIAEIDAAPKTEYRAPQENSTQAIENI